MCVSLLKKTAFQLLEIWRMYRPLREQARSHMVFNFLGNRRELRDREVRALYPGNRDVRRQKLAMWE